MDTWSGLGCTSSVAAVEGGLQLKTTLSGSQPLLIVMALDDITMTR